MVRPAIPGPPTPSPLKPRLQKGRPCVRFLPKSAGRTDFWRTAPRANLHPSPPQASHYVASGPVITLGYLSALASDSRRRAASPAKELPQCLPLAVPSRIPRSVARRLAGIGCRSHGMPCPFSRLRPSARPKASASCSCGAPPSGPTNPPTFFRPATRPTRPAARSRGRTRIWTSAPAPSPRR